MRRSYVLMFLLAAIIGCSKKPVQEYKILNPDGTEAVAECKPCIFVDEEAGIVTWWEDTDPEFAGLEKDDSGLFQPKLDSSGKIIKDTPPGYPGSKSIHIPMIKGYHWEDYVGIEYCKPCRNASKKEEFDICNASYKYSNESVVPEDLNKTFSPPSDSSKPEMSGEPY